MQKHWNVFFWGSSLLSMTPPRLPLPNTASHARALHAALLGRPRASRLAGWLRLAVLAVPAVRWRSLAGWFLLALIAGEASPRSFQRAFLFERRGGASMNSAPPRSEGGAL